MLMSHRMVACAWISVLYERLWGEGNAAERHDDAGCLASSLADEIMLIRNEYVGIWNYVEESGSSPYEEFGGLAILGQPGVGGCS